jgi:hypothetical protein
MPPTWHALARTTKRHGLIAGCFNNNASQGAHPLQSLQFKALLHAVLVLMSTNNARLKDWKQLLSKIA